MKTVIEYKEVTVKVPSSFRYTCDTCGYVFSKGERKVTYYKQGIKGTRHACIDKPCSPFSKPKDYESVWSAKDKSYIWVKKRR